MKKLSGEFLSNVHAALGKANASALSNEEIGDLLRRTLKGNDPYVELPTLQAGASTASRFATFDGQSLQRLNSMLPWSSFRAIGNGDILGTAWSQNKRNTAAPYPDPQVEGLHGRIDLTGMSVLELGCFEGHHSLSLAEHCSEVWGIDGRIENVIKTLVQVWMAGMEDRVKVNLVDLERGPLKQQLSSLGRDRPFDLVHHRGVLYHLSDPIANLIQCKDVCTKHLYLHTQIADHRQVDVELTHDGRRYAAHAYQEPLQRNSPFAGLTPVAHWLTQDSLTSVLMDIGFAKIEVIKLDEERNGWRVELIASR
ncbi:MAG: class I SAM-dependent methyltransferase [Burkholderiaceae bacterium]|jgi:hypothetical protein